jgi:hypothetical protein
MLLSTHAFFVFACAPCTLPQAARHQTLGNCRYLTEQLRAPLSLDDAKAFIREQQLQEASATGKHVPGPNDPPVGAGSRGGSGKYAMDSAAAHWLLDEELWKSRGSHSTYAPSGSGAGDAGTGAGVGGRNNINMNTGNVEADSVFAATEQHVRAMYALRTSSITYDDDKHGGTNAKHRRELQATAEALGKSAAHRKHWGAVALPLPLQVVTADTANQTQVHDRETGGGGGDPTLRGSGDWKSLRTSLNRSTDSIAGGKGASFGTGEADAGTGAAAGVPGSLNQRLLTDAKLFRPLASQWAKGNCIIPVFITLMCAC